ncbi:MAG TPA: hypothetical protein VIU11_14475 [Nakamurella sp.]
MAFLCGWLGWHRPAEIGVQRGVNLCATCRRCGAEIMRDSNGGWF